MHTCTHKDTNDFTSSAEAWCVTYLPIFVRPSSARQGYSLILSVPLLMDDERTKNVKIKHYYIVVKA